MCMQRNAAELKLLQTDCYQASRIHIWEEGAENWSQKFFFFFFHHMESSKQVQITTCDIG